MIQMAPVQTDYFPLIGGYDLVTPPLSMRPGMVRDAQNYEIGVNGGYQRIRGCERFDGRPAPSDATYTVLPCTITGSVAVADTVTGATSAATGYVIAVEAAAVVITKLTGTFTSSENLNVGGTPQATMTSSPIPSGASSNNLHWQYLREAGDAYRADIAAVTGEGDVLGVWYYNGLVYAFRNAVGGATADMWVSSAGGWTAVALGRELAFTSGGVTAIAVGNTITGAVSGATAVITAVVVTSGTWGAGDAAGYLYFASQTGTFQAENLNVGASLNLATIAGNSSALTLAPGGRYEFTNYNFGSGLKMYGCDGANRAFQFDGTTFVPITTGMTADTPSHIAGHVNHLFLSFDNSLQHSSIGDPLSWSPLLGAGELNTGETITNLLPQAGSNGAGALAVYTRNRTLVLYGTSSSDWSLVTFQSEAGAFPYTAQSIGPQTFVLDDRGITTLQTSQNYGNFDAASISKLIRPWIIENKARCIASGISRDKNQYRLFFNNGRAMYFTLEGGFMPILFPFSLTCYTSSENTSGDEVAYAGDEDGYVYRMDVGNNFDGAQIESFLGLVFNHVKSPRLRKRYRKAVVEVQGTGYATFWMNAALSYDSTEVEQVPLSELIASLSSGAWDSGTWDTGVWDGRILAPAEFELNGTAENIALRFAQSTDYQEPLIFHGVILHYTPRRQLR